MIDEQLAMEYVKGASLPDGGIDWYDSDDRLIDFSSGHTFEVKVGSRGQVALLGKSAGITGDDTAPNVTIGWSADELDVLPAGVHTGQARVVRQVDGRDYIKQFRLTIIEPVL